MQGDEDVPTPRSLEEQGHVSSAARLPPGPATYCHAFQHCKQNDEKCSLLMKTSSVWSIFLSLHPLSLEMLSKGTLEMLIKGKKYSFSMSWWENGCI